MNITQIKKSIIGLVTTLGAVLHLDLIIEIVGAISGSAGSLFTAFSISAFTLGDALPAWIPVGALEAGALGFGALYVTLKLANVVGNIKDSIDD